VIHGAVAEDTGQTHGFALVKQMLESEGEDVIARLGADSDAAQKERYRKSVKIAMRWIKNYAEFDFRSLGTYTHRDLDAVAAASDAF
jgi:lysyl-tRNA synthetase class I